MNPEIPDFLTNFFFFNLIINYLIRKFIIIRGNKICFHNSELFLNPEIPDFFTSFFSLILLSII